ncbi:hypothetical protein D3C81_1301360 [compost metagenome]
MTQQVEVVDQVGQQEASPRLATPWGFEVAVRFLQLPQCGDIDQPAQLAVGNHLVRLGDQWIVPPVMADQHWHTPAARALYQCTNFIQVHAHRLLDQHWHAGLDAIQRGSHMQVVRVGNDHRLGAHTLQHLPVVGKTGHAALGGKGLGLRARVGHRAQLGLRHVTQVLIVLAAHDAGANQGNTKGCVQQPVLLSLLLSKF